MVHLQLIAFQHILDGFGKVFYAQALDVHLRQLLTDAQS